MLITNIQQKHLWQYSQNYTDRIYIIALFTSKSDPNESCNNIETVKK